MRVYPKERDEEVTALTEREEGRFLLNPVKDNEFLVLPRREKKNSKQIKNLAHR